VIGAVEVIATMLAAKHQQDLGPRPFDLRGYLLLGLGPALLLWRGRCPSVVLVAVLGATLAYSLFDYPRGPIFLALIVAFVHTVLDGKRMVAYLTLLVGYLSLTFLVAQVTGRERPGLPFLIGIAAWLLVLLVGSEWIRIQRAYFGERRRRRREMELAQEAEARRRASEERLEIARELHDVMAHSISLINVQAGVALELMDRRPEQARQALTAIKAASKDALLEVQSMLAALRGPGDPMAADGARAPVPSLSALDEIVGRARLSGVKVHTRVDGDPVPLPAGPDQAAARIVQEALTNVARHAETAVARLRVTYFRDGEQAEVVIVVDNDGPARPAPDALKLGGRGVSGMRERAEACGGTLQAGPRRGGFRVVARLPFEEENLGDGAMGDGAMGDGAIGDGADGAMGDGGIEDGGFEDERIGGKKIEKIGDGRIGGDRGTTT
jgi:signal transduction histidine kinase